LACSFFSSASAMGCGVRSRDDRIVIHKNVGLRLRARALLLPAHDAMPGGQRGLPEAGHHRHALHTHGLQLMGWSYALSIASLDRHLQVASQGRAAETAFHRGAACSEDRGCCRQGLACIPSLAVMIIQMPNMCLLQVHTA
jgi:hypothetical protein